jgi:predicted  nucleic acid-binding Zn-ribbon protein
MPIHIGEIIKLKADEKNLALEAVGRLINRTRQTVADIYKRQSIDTALLVDISKALEFDFFELYYAEEPLKSMREKELAPFKKEIEGLKRELSNKEQRIADLERTINSNEVAIQVLREEQQRYKNGGI